MKKIITIISILLMIFITTVSVNAEPSFNITIKFFDSNETEIKEKTVITYSKDENVEISIADYQIEGYEIKEVIKSDRFNETDQMLFLDAINDNEEIIIKYELLYNYTVNYYLDEDELALIKTEIRQGRLNEAIPKESDLENLDNLEIIGKDETVIEKEGSTINIYYKYKSYFIYFDLNGGLGVNTIYQKYGTKINLKDIPYKEGYEFEGWYKEKECLNKIDSDNLYVEGETTYYAGYKEVYEEALVTIVFYGENANDDNYSYLGKTEKYLPVGSTYSYDPNETNEYFHKHDLSCFGVTSLKPAELEEFELEGFMLLSEDLEDGYVYARVDKSIVDKVNYYYRYNGNFYKSDKYHISYQVGETKKLKDFILKDEFRLFKPAYSCGASYVFNNSDTITVHELDNLVYVYLKRCVYTLSFGNDHEFPNDYYGCIETKWGELIYREYNSISTIDDDLYGWTPINKRNEGATKILISMPKENCNYYLSSKDTGSVRINYWIKVNDKYEKLYSTNWLLGTLHTTDTDYIDVEGFSLNKELSITKEEFLKPDKDSNNIYYDPNIYDLVLVAYSDEAETFKITYGDTLSVAKDYKPVARYDYEIFNGWYLNEDLSGEAIDLNLKKMPSHNLTLFAKWQKKEFEVRFIDNKTSLNEIRNIPYDEFITDIPEINDPDFVGWIKDDNNIIIDLESYKVTDNVNFYALYHHDKYIDYTIHYLTEDGINVTNDTKGSIIAGNKIYIYPKQSSSLNYPYKNEYKPEATFYVFEVDDIHNEFNIYYLPYLKYTLNIKTKGLNDDSAVIYISGKGFDDLEVVLNNEVTVSGLYEFENYKITFDNSYLYKYEINEPLSFSITDNKTVEINFNKKLNDYFNIETHKLNIFK